MSDPTIRLARLIDDDEADRLLIHTLIDHSELLDRLDSCASGEEVWQTLKDSARVPATLVIVDILMHRISGFTLLDRMKAVWGAQIPPVVVMTASTDTEDRRQAESHPKVGDVARKPVPAPYLTWAMVDAIK